MKVIEGNPDDLLNRWPLLLDTDSMRSVGLAWLFKEGGTWNFRPRIPGDVSLFYNAVFFLRLNWPLGIFASVRWSASTTEKALLQLGAGWKLNGRIALLLRIQSDATSAAGASGPNYGQATGFNYGTH
jgi:hypothetical protein